MTKKELIRARAESPGLIRLKDGRMFYGLVTAYDIDAVEGGTIQLTPVHGDPIVIRIEEIDAE